MPTFAPIMRSLVEKYADYIELIMAQHSSKLTAEQLDMLDDTLARMFERSGLIISEQHSHLLWEYNERTLALIEERRAARRRAAEYRRAQERRRERERDEHVARILMEALCE